jgi:hypothetical protein
MSPENRAWKHLEKVLTLIEGRLYFSKFCNGLMIQVKAQYLTLAISSLIHLQNESDNLNGERVANWFARVMIAILVTIPGMIICLKWVKMFTNEY